MKTKSLFCTVALGAAVSLGSTALAKSSHHSEGLSDAAFAKKAAAGGLTEVALGQLATQNGASQDVKDFGAKMVTDHGKANDSLKTVAENDKLTIPDKPTADQQAMIDKMTKLSGAAFDKAYVHAMVKAHIADKALFTAEASSAKAPDLKQFVEDTLPVITEHLTMIEGIEKGGAMSKMSDSTTHMSGGESKSGPAPGGNSDSASSAPSTTGNMPATDSNSGGSAGQSKSGLAPGGNAAPAPGQ